MTVLLIAYATVTTVAIAVLALVAGFSRHLAREAVAREHLLAGRVHGMRVTMAEQSVVLAALRKRTSDPRSDVDPSAGQIWWDWSGRPRAVELKAIVAGCEPRWRGDVLGGGAVLWGPEDFAHARLMRRDPCDVDCTPSTRRPAVYQ